MASRQIRNSNGTWRAVLLGVLALLATKAGNGFGQEACPGKPNAHVIERVVRTDPNGTIRRTTRCACNEGFEPAGDGSCRKSPTIGPSRETVIRAQTRPECIRFAGEALRDDLRACEGPILRCLKTEGVPGEAASCAFGTLATAIPFAVSAAADPTKGTTFFAGAALGNALSSCQANVRNVAAACGPVAGACEEKALKAHKAATAACPSR